MRACWELVTSMDGLIAEKVSFALYDSIKIALPCVLLKIVIPNLKYRRMTTSSIIC
jgi:hypothetical protein